MTICTRFESNADVDSSARMIHGRLASASVCHTPYFTTRELRGHGARPMAHVQIVKHVQSS
jgi:hypothetical protein